MTNEIKAHGPNGIHTWVDKGEPENGPQRSMDRGHPADHLHDVVDEELAMLDRMAPTVRWTYDRDRDTAREGVKALLRLMGEDPNREGLLDTPDRVVRAYLELADRPGDPQELLAKVFGDADHERDEMVTVGPVEFTSLCEHHLLPFTGKAWVSYIPGEKVVGLSKLGRLVEHYAHRPQVQERLTVQIVEAIQQHLNPLGAAVLVKASHSCMGLRGVRKPDALMTTTALRGRYTQAAVRAEFLAAAQNGH